MYYTIDPVDPVLIIPIKKYSNKNISISHPEINISNNKFHFFEIF